MPSNSSLKLSKLKPTEVVKAVNSTPLGTVIGTSQVYRHFEQGGFRIASSDDERCINLGKYCAWLIDQLDAGPPATPRAVCVPTPNGARRRGRLWPSSPSWGATSGNSRRSRTRSARRPADSTSSSSARPTFPKCTSSNGRRITSAPLPRSNEPCSRAVFSLLP